MKNVILIIVGVLLLNGCKKVEKPVVISKELLQGQWNDSGENEYNLGGINYSIFFSENAFKLHIYEYSDYYLANCGLINSWDNYIKGTFTLSQNILYLNGDYCDSLYQVKVNTDCQEVTPIGMYNDSLVLKLINNKSLSFSNKIASTTVLLKQ